MYRRPESGKRHRIGWFAPKARCSGQSLLVVRSDIPGTAGRPDKRERPLARARIPRDNTPRRRGMGQLTRFGVSLDDALLGQFDRMIQRKGYTNRSEALRDLIREGLVREQWELGTEAAVGTLTLVYDHEVRELADRLTDLQHAHYQDIVSTLHVHLDAHHCLEVLVLRGKAAALKAIADRLIGTRGVKHGTFSATAEGRILA
jgi:CopG family nickel-responsive transcriptional regulator